MKDYAEYPVFTRRKVSLKLKKKKISKIIFLEIQWEDVNKIQEMGNSSHIQYISLSYFSLHREDVFSTNLIQDAAVDIFSLTCKLNFPFQLRRRAKIKGISVFTNFKISIVWSYMIHEYEIISSWNILLSWSLFSQPLLLDLVGRVKMWNIYHLKRHTLHPLIS